MIKKQAKTLSRIPLKTYGFLVFFFLSIFFHTQDVFGCSTFMLKKDSALIVGHNLDSGRHKPGVVVINKRGVLKQGKSWSELAYGKTVPNPPIKWISKYGSITFNKYRSFPDGGVNEKGIFIVEMSLKGTGFPKDQSKPMLFMMLWMQYVLDNYESVDQVVNCLNHLTIEGWSWHFFTADRKGNAAAIDLVDGKVVVHKGPGPSLPVPVLQNSTYAKEIERLKTYKGFGGDKPVDLNNLKQPIFVHGAQMLKDYDPSKKPAVDYGFDILAQFSWEGTQWSYVCDLANLKVFFKSKVSQKVKVVDFKDFDWSCKTPVKMLDIHADLSGPVEKNFRYYSLEYNRECVRTAFVTGNYEPVFTSHGSTLKEAVERFSAYPESTKCTPHTHNSHPGKHNDIAASPAPKKLIDN